MIQKPSDIEWLVSVPEGKTFTVALKAACRGNDKLANLLNYFLYEAACEAKRQGIDKDTAKYIEIKRKPDAILKALSKHNKSASRKTIHDRIVDLTFEKAEEEGEKDGLGYLEADGYHQTYRVFFKNIEKALANPPEAEKPKLRGRHANKQASQDNSEQSEDGNFESKVKSSISTPEIEYLRQEMSSLTSQMSNLTFQMSNLTSELAHERACREELEAKIASLYITDTLLDTASKVSLDTPPTHPALNSLNGHKQSTESPSQTTLPFKPTIVLSPEEQTVFDEWQKMPWFKGVPQKVTANTPQYCRKLAPYNPTVETMKAVKKWATSSEVDKRNYYKGKAWSLYFLAEEYPKWLSTQADNEPTPFPSPNSRLVVSPYKVRGASK